MAPNLEFDKIGLLVTSKAGNPQEIRDRIYHDHGARKQLPSCTIRTSMLFLERELTS